MLEHCLPADSTRNLGTCRCCSLPPGTKETSTMPGFHTALETSVDNPEYLDGPGMFPYREQPIASLNMEAGG
jgi:hypothetical protein